MPCAFQIIRNGRFFAAIIALAVCASATAAPPALRIVSYNIQADTGGFTGPRPGLYTVLEGIGEQNRNGVWQPLDVLALQETTSNTTSVAPIVTALNNYYGAGTYALVAYQGTQHGGASSGNGPNALLYNTVTLQLVLQNGAQAIGVSGTPNSNGVNRQVVRYEFQPVAGTVEDRFYVYVSHMKSSASGDESQNQAARNLEAQLIRTDAATLSAGASILYVGDFNIGAAAEAAYATLTSSGQGQAIDPFTWTNPTPANLMSWASTGIRYRDDIQFVSSNVASNAAVAGLHYINSSCRVFGNNGSVAIGGSVNSQSNTALNDLVGPISPASVRSALTTASDHLPIVADYLVITPYEAWREQNFSAAELSDPAISGDAADPDADWISNLMEYALALDPNTPDAQGLPKPGKTTVGSSKYMTLTYRKPKISSDLIYTVEVSNNLSTWFSGSTYTAIVSITDNPDGITQTVVVRDRTAMADQASRHMRLGVTN
jgi:endonuclease/exonuclease/phosphatase family metal-dependent hydrolase